MQPLPASWRKSLHRPQDNSWNWGFLLPHICKGRKGGEKTFKLSPLSNYPEKVSDALLRPLPPLIPPYIKEWSVESYRFSRANLPRMRLLIKGSGSVQKSQSSKAAAVFTRGAYAEYVSTEKWRERRWRLFSTDPGGKSHEYLNLLIPDFSLLIFHFFLRVAAFRKVRVGLELLFALYMTFETGIWPS